jgi:hypothetical protein
MQQSNSMLGRNTALYAAIAALGLASFAAGGCQRAIDPHNMGEDPNETATTFDSRMDFWHTLATDRICSNDEAFHGLLLYIDQADKAKNFDERVKLMKYLGMLPDGFDGKAKEAVTRGTVAVAVVKVLEIKGGIILHVFPKSERYATRELVFEGVYPPSTQNQVFSGSEFVGIIGRIEDYQRMMPKAAQVVAAGSAADKVASPPKPAVGDPAPQAPAPVTP